MGPQKCLLNERSHFSEVPGVAGTKTREPERIELWSDELTAVAIFALGALVDSGPSGELTVWVLSWWRTTHRTVDGDWGSPTVVHTSFRVFSSFRFSSCSQSTGLRTTPLRSRIRVTLNE